MYDGLFVCNCIVGANVVEINVGFDVAFGDVVGLKIVELVDGDWVVLSVVAINVEANVGTFVGVEDGGFAGFEVRLIERLCVGRFDVLVVELTVERSVGFTVCIDGFNVGCLDFSDVASREGLPVGSDVGPAVLEVEMKVGENNLLGELVGRSTSVGLIVRAEIIVGLVDDEEVGVCVIRMVGYIVGLFV